MGEWGQVTFFRTDDLDALERAIGDLCLAEGLQAAPYVPRKRETWDRMQYGTGATSDRWAIALGAGRGGWSVVKTAPLELLAEPGSSGEHRLGIIARVLRCEALHVSLYDGTAIEGREVFELPGLCTAMASTSRRVALALVTPGFVHERSQGYGQDDAAVIVVIDVDTGEVDELLRSDERLTFGFTHLCFAGDVLGVRAERDGVPVIVTLGGGKRMESPGDFRQWAREAMRVPLGVDDLYSTYETPMLWAGPDAVVAVEASSLPGSRADCPLPVPGRVG